MNHQTLPNTYDVYAFLIFFYDCLMNLLKNYYPPIFSFFYDVFLIFKQSMIILKAFISYFYLLENVSNFLIFCFSQLLKVESLIILKLNEWES